MRLIRLSPGPLAMPFPIPKGALLVVQDGQVLLHVPVDPILVDRQVLDRTVPQADLQQPSAASSKP